MKKFVLALILIVAVAGMAIESGPSNTVGFVTHTATAGAAGTGFSFVTYSLANEDYNHTSEIAAMFEGTGLTISYISRYNNESKSWQLAPFDLNLGDNVLVALNGNAEFTYATFGDVPEDYSVSFNLTNNYNFITIPLNINELYPSGATVGDITDDIGQVSYMAKFNPVTQSWGIANATTEVQIGDVFVVARDAAADAVVWPAALATASNNLKIKDKTNSSTHESSVDQLIIKKK
jgi:hypothetical protein